jgi:hypothetical protein
VEQFANAPTATLNGSINNSVATLTASGEVNIPSSGTFRALIDSEIIKVTAVSSHTWTIVRGDGGTTAASHANGATITVIVTAEAMNALVSIQNAGSEISNRRILNFINAASIADNSGNSRCDITLSAGQTFEATWCDGRSENVARAGRKT